MMKKISKYFVVLLSTGLLLVTTGCNSGLITSEPPSDQSQSSQPQADPFRDAVNKATKAAELAQVAKTSEEWTNVADSWQQAVSLMKAVPESSLNYNTAQQKAVEYQANLEYAQRNANIEALELSNSFSTTQICRAGIAVVMGRDPSIIKSNIQGDMVFLSYLRPDDGSEWKYRCRVEGQRIVWASDPGRWRTDSADEQLFFRVIEAEELLEVEERYGDGSSTIETFNRSQLGN